MIDFLHTNLSYFLSGISVGGQYALIAIGYTMVYGILRLINFAHGDVFMCAGLMMVYLSASYPMYISIPLTLILTVLLGFLIERVAYRPLRNAPRMSVMISAIGVSYLIQNAALYFTGGLAKIYPEIPLLSHTVTTFVIGSLLAGIGSILYFSNYSSVVPTSGSMPGLKAFVAAVFGGIGSIPGAVIGAFIIGICENIIRGGASIFGIPGTGWTTFSDAFTFALLIVILVVKPTGLFGEKSIDKV